MHGVPLLNPEVMTWFEEGDSKAGLDRGDIYRNRRAGVLSE